jgi:hypothetical protein
LVNAQLKWIGFDGHFQSTIALFYKRGLDHDFEVSSVTFNVKYKKLREKEHN